MHNWLLFTFNKAAIFSSFSSSSSFLFQILTFLKKFFLFLFILNFLIFFSPNQLLKTKRRALKQNRTFQLLSNFEEIQTNQCFKVCNLKFSQKKSPEFWLNIIDWFSYYYIFSNQHRLCLDKWWLNWLFI